MAAKELMVGFIGEALRGKSLVEKILLTVHQTQQSLIFYCQTFALQGQNYVRTCYTWYIHRKQCNRHGYGL